MEKNKETYSLSDIQRIYFPKTKLSELIQESQENPLFKFPKKEEDVENINGKPRQDKK